MTNLLQTNELTKMIDGKTLVKGVNMHVKKGEIYGFLGPNGAGKTTVMKMVTNLWKPTAGTVELFGETLTPTSYGLLKRIGSMIEFPCFYDHMSGKENLRLHCEYMGYYAGGSVEHALQALELSDAADKPVKSYSLGMKQRLGIARAVISKPELLVLDEPTNGLDPAGMKKIRELLRRLCTEYGITILLSSHILSELQQTADTFGFLHKGQILEELPAKKLLEQCRNYLSILVNDPQSYMALLEQEAPEDSCRVLADHRIEITNPGREPEFYSQLAAQHSILIRGLEQRHASLEEYFINLKGGRQ